MLVTYVVNVKGSCFYITVNALCVFVILVVQPCKLKRNLHVSTLFRILLRIPLSAPLYFNVLFWLVMWAYETKVLID